jgi:hypothetical protein
MRRPLLAIVVVLSAISTAPSYAQNSILGDNYSIMVPEKGYKPSKPEPWLAPKYATFELSGHCTSQKRHDAGV